MDIGGDATYSSFTRLNPEGFDFLLSLVNEDITGQPGFRLPIPADMKLAVTLRYQSWRPVKWLLLLLVWITIEK